MAQPVFSVGEIILHRRFGYRGVIVGVDETYCGSEVWYEQVALSRPPKAAPWYHVLVDRAQHTTYVAERHLEPGDASCQIEHPELGRYFDRFAFGRYHLRSTSE